MSMHLRWAARTQAMLQCLLPLVGTVDTTKPLLQCRMPSIHVLRLELHQRQNNRPNSKHDVHVGRISNHTRAILFDLYRILIPIKPERWLACSVAPFTDSFPHKCARLFGRNGKKKKRKKRMMLLSFLMDNLFEHVFG